MKTVKDLKVGDTVWYSHVNVDHGKTLRETKVIKIGTKIIYTTQLDFYKDDLCQHGLYNHAKLILNPEQFYDDIKAKNLTRDIVDKLKYEGQTNRPSLDTLKKVCDLLGLVY